MAATKTEILCVLFRLSSLNTERFSDSVLRLIRPQRVQRRYLDQIFAAREGVNKLLLQRRWKLISI